MADFVIWVRRALQWVFAKGERPVHWLIGILVILAVAGPVFVFFCIPLSSQAANVIGPALGAFVGLCAILIGALINGMQNRRLERWKRKKRLMGIARGLFDELRQAASWHTAAPDPPIDEGDPVVQHGDKYFPRRVLELPAYNRCLEHYGELPLNVTELVSNAFVMIDGMNRRYVRLADEIGSYAGYRKFIAQMMPTVEAGLQALRVWMDAHAYLDDE